MTKIKGKSFSSYRLNLQIQSTNSPSCRCPSAFKACTFIHEAKDLRTSYFGTHGYVDLFHTGSENSMRGNNWEHSLPHFQYTALTNEHFISCFFTLWEPKIFARSFVSFMKRIKAQHWGYKWTAVYFSIAVQLSVRTSSHCMVRHWFVFAWDVA